VELRRWSRGITSASTRGLKIWIKVNVASKAKKLIQLELVRFIFFSRITCSSVLLGLSEAEQTSFTLERKVRSLSSWTQLVKDRVACTQNRGGRAAVSP
jgi:hypothetical protein